MKLVDGKISHSGGSHLTSALVFLSGSVTGDYSTRVEMGGRRLRGLMNRKKTTNKKFKKT